MNPTKSNGLTSPQSQPAKSLNKRPAIFSPINLQRNAFSEVANKFASRGHAVSRIDDDPYSNTRWLADQGHSDVMIQMAREAILEHGMPPSDADVAAAHEAGHVIVGLAMGGAFDDAFIVSNAGRWEGFSKVSIPGVHSKEDCNILTHPRRGWLLGLQRAGGIHGEMFIGRYHPASSIDEAFVMNSLAHGLGDLFGVPMDWVAACLTIATMRLITANRDAFEIVRSALLANKSLTAAEAAALPIVKFSLDEMVPAWLLQPQTSFKSKSAGKGVSGQKATT
jgi:hypothetical protein